MTVCVHFGEATGTKESQAVYILLLLTHIIYMLLKKDYLHFKVKAYLMDHHGFLHWHLNKPTILWSWYWGHS